MYIDVQSACCQHLFPVMHPAVFIIPTQSLYGQCICKKWWAVSTMETDPIFGNFLSNQWF